jgi:4'-phosphopantetheinyl transferase
VAEVLGEAVHVWLCRVDTVPDPDMLARCAQLLDAVETRRWQRYRFDKDRHLFLVGHALLRSTLSRYADVDPARWRFRLQEFGRPEVAGPQTNLDLRFNLSHTRGLAVVLVTLGTDCGVDVEPADRSVDIESLARRNFADSERTDVLARADEDQRRRFLEYWTLKESYIKARGVGLALPLTKFTMTVGDRVTIAFDPAIDDDPEDWQFHLVRPAATHQLAVAVRRGPALDRPVVVRETTMT